MDGEEKFPAYVTGARQRVTIISVPAGSLLTGNKCTRGGEGEEGGGGRNEKGTAIPATFSSRVIDRYIAGAATKAARLVIA